MLKNHKLIEISTSIVIDHDSESRYKLIGFIDDDKNKGGKVIDGRTGSLLDLTPERVHQKSPCFMGSPLDVEEFEKYLENSRGKRRGGGLKA